MIRKLALSAVAAGLFASSASAATLVTADRIRSSVKRLFRNRIDEVLSELFQNSQRSGSTTVDITTTDNTIIIQDLADRVSDAYGCPHEPHLIMPKKVA